MSCECRFSKAAHCLAASGAATHYQPALKTHLVSANDQCSASGVLLKMSPVCCKSCTAFFSSSWLTTCLHASGSNYKLRSMLMVPWYLYDDAHTSFSKNDSSSMQSCAAEKQQQQGLSLKWLRCAGSAPVPQAAVGVLGLHPDTIQRALTEQALGLLLPPTLQITFQPSEPPSGPTQPPSSSQDQLGSSFPSGSHLQYQSVTSQADTQSQMLSSYNQQMSPPRGKVPEAGSSSSNFEWRRLSGGPDGAGFGGNRGSLWAMVASVGSLVPMSMQVCCCFIPLLPRDPVSAWSLMAICNVVHGLLCCLHCCAWQSHLACR